MDPDNCIVYEVQNCEWNWGQRFFFLLSFVPLATILPIWVVARFIWLPYVRKVQQDALDYESEQEIPYEYQFPPEDAENDNEDLDGLMSNYAMETTPDGLVIMRYNKKDEGFEYWADKTIAYKYLEAVARKYVTMFHCGGLYINRGGLLREKLQKLEKEINENKKQLENEDDENEDNEEQKEESVFAKLKSNKANKPENKLKITRDDVVCEKSNKYMKRGEIKESMLYASKKEETEKSTLGFADWKKCFDFGATFKMDEEHNWPTDD